MLWPHVTTVANAMQTEGGYFTTVVFQWPSSFCPTAFSGGSSTRTRRWRKWKSTVMLMATRSVGLGVGAPMRPWEKHKRCAPGISTLPPGRSSGSAGCSRMPKPPVAAISIMASNEKPNRQFPTRSCFNSLIDTLSYPQRNSTSRMTRGLHWPVVLCPTTLTRDQDSQGGPPRNANTQRDRIASSQKRRVCALATSPQVASPPYQGRWHGGRQSARHS